MKNHRKYICLGIFLVIFLFIRHQYQLSLLETDEGSYAYIAQEILHGKLPYVDFFDHKPIMVYLIYTLTLLIFGLTNTYAIKLTSTIAIIITVFFLYKIVQKQSGKYLAIATSTLYLVSTCTPYIQYSTANTEVYMTMFIVIALYFTLIDELRIKNPILCGLLIGIATLTKTTALANFIAIIVYLVIKSRKVPFVFILTVLITITIPSIYYFINGHLAEYIFANFTYNSEYTDKLLFPNRIINFPLEIILENPFIWIVGIISTFRYFNKQTNHYQLLNILNLIFSLLLIQFIGRGSPHYYIQTIPFLCILAGDLIYRTKSQNSLYIITKSFFISSLIFSVVLTLLVTTKPKFMLQNIYLSYGRGEWYAQSYQLAKKLKSYIKPGDYVYNLGRESQLLFYLQARSSSKYYYDRVYWLYPETINRICQDLLTNKPKVIINTLTPPYFDPTMGSILWEKISKCTNINVQNKMNMDFAEIWFVK